MENASKPFTIDSLRHHNQETTAVVFTSTPTVTTPATRTFLPTQISTHRSREGLDFNSERRQIRNPNFNPRVPPPPPCIFDSEPSIISPALFGTGSACPPFPLYDSEVDSDCRLDYDSDFTSDDDGYGNEYDDINEEYDDDEEEYDDDEEDEIDDYAHGNQVSFVLDLFERGVNNRTLDLSLGRSALSSDDMDDSDYPNCRALGGDEEERGVNSVSEVDLELGLGLGGGGGSEYARNSSSSSVLSSKPSEFGSVLSEESPSTGGLREAGIDSETDSEENVVLNDLYTTEIDDFDEIESMNGIGAFDHDDPFGWNYLGLNNEERSNDFDFETEEGGDAVAELEAASNLFTERVGHGIDDEDDDPFIHWDHYAGDEEEDGDVHFIASVPSAVIDVEEEIEFGGDLERDIEDLEWELLHAVNNFNTELEDTFLGVVEESLNEWKGNPPASKSVIDRLPLVSFSEKEIKEQEITCAVCKVDLCVDEQVRKLPCEHCYHGDCIIPWLGIRNTCPVCRFELPTDDPEYELWKRQSSGFDDDEDEDDDGEYYDDEDEDDDFSEDLFMNDGNFHQFL